MSSAASPLALPPWKLWVFRFVLAVILPAVLLLALELSLRIFSFGHPTKFLLPFRKDGKNYLAQNNQFGWRFFGKQMARTPHPIFIPQHKLPGAIRIFVFGESAAFGDPQPGFGLPRMLQAMLEQRHPENKFEVVNAAMTGINSHVILPIARDCAAAEGDIWVIYMGNNEVIGPFGAGTVFGRQTLPLPLIRASLALQASRVGQLLESALRRDSGQEWGGMVMFMNQQVRLNDSRLSAVYRNFKDNLDAIIKTGRRSGAGVVVSTVAVNLKDSPPFASAHRAGLLATEATNWTRFREEGMKARSNGDTSTAAQSFSNAARIDDQFAELRFVMGGAAIAVNDLERAQREYHAARDLDILRFRCDTRLNELIRLIAKNHDKERVLLADVEQNLADECVDHLPGEEFFYDHVHLTFEGNYRLAKAITPQVELLLESRFPRALSSDLPWPSLSDCAERLGWSPLAQRIAWTEMLPRLTDPPFVNQLDHAAHLSRVGSKIAELTSATTPAGIAMALTLNEAALSKHPEDEDLCVQTSQLAEATGQTDNAVTLAQRAVKLSPTSIEAWGRLGTALEKQLRFKDAASAYRHILTLDSEAYYALNNLGRVEASLGRSGEAIVAYRRALKLKPRFGPAWLSLGELLEASGKKAEAEDCYRKALANRIRNAAELNRLATFCHDRGWFEAAATNRAEAITLNPTDVSACLHAGQDFATAGLRANAKKYFAESVRLDPESAPARFLLGREFGIEGNAVAAEEQFRAASRLMPTLSEARVNLAITLVNQGRVADAIAEYEAVLKQWPTNQMARRNLERLRSSTGDIRP